MATIDLAHSSAPSWPAGTSGVRLARPRLAHARVAARQVGALAGASALTVTVLAVVGSLVGTLS